MRNLDLDEITNKISDYSLDILYSDRNHLDVKIDQFFNFLYEQPISKRTLERISEDFNEIQSKIQDCKNNFDNYKAKKEIIELLKTREIQGAFGYFEIKNRFEKEQKYSNHFIELSKSWYTVRGEYSEYQEYFNTCFFKPFIELLEWYFRESKIKQEIDYFSREEISHFNENFELLKQQITKLEYGQQTIFNETDEIKGLINGLNKKNWTELIKGKFIDMVLGSVISIENAELLIKTLIGEKISLK